MADVKFTDYSIQVKEALGDALTAFLYEAAGEIEAQTKRNTPLRLMYSARPSAQAAGGTFLKLSTL